MARIVLGLGTSHSPMMSTPVEHWPGLVERDQADTNLMTRDGVPHTYEEMLQIVRPDMELELTPAKWTERFEACQLNISKIGEVLAEAKLDVLVMIGDDQHEMFSDTNSPAIMVYWGDTFRTIPRLVTSETGKEDSLMPAFDASRRASSWALGEEEHEYPVASKLGLHLVESLVDEEFDVAHSNVMRPGQSMGHAFSFIYRRIMNGNVVPTVPIMLNTYYPPNQLSSKRAYDLGSALRNAIESWPEEARVGVIASGGLSHFVIDEDRDRMILEALRTQDSDTLRSLDRPSLQSGTSETLNWITTGGAVGHLTMDLIGYVPCYRTPAGTGTAMAFAQWA
jgi:hypothetical protein